MNKNDTIEWIKEYIKAQKEVIDSIDPEQVKRVMDILYDTRVINKQIFVIGNGGSSSNSSHFSTDLGKSASDTINTVVKGNRFRVMSLNENMSWITAIGNDYSYDDIFVRQLENYAIPGDVLLILGVSGTSKNIIKAAKWAKDNGIYIIGFMGYKFPTDGTLKDIAHECFIIDDTHYGRVEDTEMVICHLLTYVFTENKYFQE